MPQVRGEDGMRTLQDLFFHVVGSFPPRKVLLRIRAGRGFREITVKEFERAVRELAQRLLAWGIRPGDRVALFSENRPEWHIVDFACQLVGAVDVPLYATLPAPHVRYIVQDSGARLLIVSGKERARVALEAASGLDVKVVGIDPDLAPGLQCLEDLPLPSKRKQQELPVVGEEDLATLIYTSGTTGEPKGVMLTHRNLIS